MEKFIARTDANPIVHIHEVSGDLTIKGHSLSEVILKAPSPETTNFTVENNKVIVVAHGGGTLYVPHGATVELVNIDGSAVIKSLDGALRIDNVSRELTLRDVGATVVENIGMDLTAKRVRGDLKIHNIGRGAIVRDIDGQFVAENIGAHLNLRDVSGGVTAVVGGHADVTLAPVPWQTYDISAGGHINCRLAEDAQAEIDIASGGQQIHINIPEMAKVLRQGSYTFKLGEGEAHVHLAAGGHVEVRSSSGWETFGGFQPDVDINLEEIDGLAEEIEQQVASQIDSMTEELDTYLENMTGKLRSAGLSDREAERINQRVQLAQERLTRAQERSRNATERAKARIHQRLEAAKRRARSHGHFSGVHIPHPPPAPGNRFIWSASASGQPGIAETEGASEEERLLILKMLEEKKISVEEAEQLLAALEGK